MDKTTLPDFEALAGTLAVAIGEAKPAWTSQTIIAGLAQLITAAALLVGIDLDLSRTTLVVGLVAMAAFACVGIVGRFRAHRPIAPLLPPRA